MPQASSKDLQAALAALKPLATGKGKSDKVIILLDGDRWALAMTAGDRAVGGAVTALATPTTPLPDYTVKASVPYKQLQAILKSNFPTCELEADDFVLHVGGVTIPCNEADDFTMPVESLRRIGDVETKSLMDAVRACAPAMANNDPRLYLNGMALLQHEKGFVMVATDGHVLACKPVATDLDLLPVADKARVRAFLPALLVRMFTVAGVVLTDVDLNVSRGAVYGRVPGKHPMVVRMSYVTHVSGHDPYPEPDGRFPDCYSLLNRLYEPIATFDKADLSAACDTMLTGHTTSDPNMMVVEPDGMTVTIRSPWQQAIQCPVVSTGRPTTPGALMWRHTFNPRFVMAALACLSVAPDGEVAFAQEAGGGYTTLWSCDDTRVLVMGCYHFESGWVVPDADGKWEVNDVKKDKAALANHLFGLLGAQTPEQKEQMARAVLVHLTREQYEAYIGS